MFYETGGVEAGIDGFIELRDSLTGVVGNQILQVQGKARDSARYSYETDEGFTWIPEEADLQYWLRGTAPVVVVVVRLSDKTAYWKTVKDYFRANPQDLPGRRIRFDKARDAFTADAKAGLLDVAARTVPGAVGPPARIVEEMLLNLVRVSHVGPVLYLAETEHRSNKAFGAALRAVKRDGPGEWVVKGGKVLSFHDLREFPWDRVCRSETSECFPVDQWALVDDRDEQRTFVELLNRALSAFCSDELFSDGKSGLRHFRRPRGRMQLAFGYPGPVNQTSRKVVREYTRKEAGFASGYFRHSAFAGNFVRIEDDWFLEVTPTYRFTSDGYHDYNFAEDRLKGIKALENNGAVLGQFMMWQHYLTQPRVDMLKPAYPFLAFAPLDGFQVGHGVPDDLWRSQESEQERVDLFSPEAPDA